MSYEPWGLEEAEAPVTRAELESESLPIHIEGVYLGLVLRLGSPTALDLAGFVNQPVKRVRRRLSALQLRGYVIRSEAHRFSVAPDCPKPAVIRALAYVDAIEALAG